MLALPVILESQDDMSVVKGTTRTERPSRGPSGLPTVCRQDEMSSLSIGKHVLKIQGQRIALIVVTGYGESNELVAEVDGPRLVVENVDPAIDKKIKVFLETLFTLRPASQ